MFTVRYAKVDPQKIKWRLVRNPHYNNDHVSLNNWCRLPLRDQRKPRLQDAIEESIRDEGVRNPIVIYALPEGLFLCFGGTRLRAAQNLGLDEIPCIINDHTGKYADCPEVTPENVCSFFRDPPPWWDFEEFGFDCHYYLERMRRENATGAGFAWLSGRDKDFVHSEMPWATDLLPED